MIVVSVVIDQKSTHLVELDDTLTLAAAEQQVASWASARLKLANSAASALVNAIVLPTRGDTNLATGEYTAPIDRAVGTLSSCIAQYSTLVRSFSAFVSVRF
jgi:hypothetical protein